MPDRVADRLLRLPVGIGDAPAPAGGAAVEHLVPVAFPLLPPLDPPPARPADLLSLRAGPPVIRACSGVQPVLALAGTQITGTLEFSSTACAVLPVISLPTADRFRRPMTSRSAPISSAMPRMLSVALRPSFGRRISYSMPGLAELGLDGVDVLAAGVHRVGVVAVLARVQHGQVGVGELRVGDGEVEGRNALGRRGVADQNLHGVSVWAGSAAPDDPLEPPDKTGAGGHRPDESSVPAGS